MSRYTPTQGTSYYRNINFRPKLLSAFGASCGDKGSMPPGWFRSIVVRCGISLVGAVSLSHTALADFAAGERAYSLGQFSKAIEEFRPLVEHGNPKAQMMTGLMYLQGNGYARSAEKAAVWLYKAATKGNHSAQLVFGTQLLYGEGIQRDLPAALMWLTLAGQSEAVGVVEQSEIFINDAKSRMTNAQITRATKRAGHFQPRLDGFVDED
jgi:TPR repeat protein